MIAALWFLAAVLAVLWPAVLTAPLDGAPLDEPLEAIVIGVILPWLLLASPRLLRANTVRLLIVALIAFKAVTAVTFVRDGWCLRFESPVPIYLDDVRVPHSWDVRADWRSDVPRCSAIMTTNYEVLERFPAWFYNLPPANNRDPVRPNDRPPGASLQLDLSGHLRVPADGQFQILADEDVRLSAVIDDRPVTHDELRQGVTIAGGAHDVRVHGDLTRSHWSLDLRFDGAPLWTSASATMAPASTLQVWLSPAVRWMPALLVFALIAFGLREAVSSIGPAVATAAIAVAVVCAVLALTGREGLIRLLPGVLIVSAAVAYWRGARHHLAHAWVVGLPFLAIFMAMSWSRAGIFSWYSSGDDWTTYQRMAYRIFMQGYWLEGGEPTFYYQPLYRWIAGALHMVFGDSSVGELLWDAAAALIGATFAFHFVRAAAGLTWAYAASVATLVFYTVGPGWYMFGRGLSELTSTGFLYAAALCAMRGRGGSIAAVAGAGLFVTLASYTRLNNLPIALAISALALPTRWPISRLWTPVATWRHASKPVVLGVIGAIAIALHLYALRAYYYSGRYDMFFGSSTRINTMWKAGESLWQSMLSSVLMILTMSDSPRFDIRAVPLMLGAVLSVLACLRVWRFGRLPMAAVLVFLAGISSALVVRGTSYPGRFSLHLIPIAVVVCVCALAEVTRKVPARR